MNCHTCKKKLSNNEIFLKLDYSFCSNKCRSLFSYSSDKQLHQHHPYHFEMSQELKDLNPDDTYSICIHRFLAKLV